MITQEKLPLRLFCLLLVVAVFAAYWPVFGNDFVIYDDDEYVYENPEVKKGLSGDGLIWAFSHEHAANWHPLTWLSHMVDVSAYGLAPAGHHLTSLILHVLNTGVLFFLVLVFFAGGRLWPAAAVAGLFALHPLHVESVAWVAERKDVLSTLFGFCALAAYLRHRRAVHRVPWWPVPVLFALGLMAKPMLVTLPVLLLLVDCWPLGRLTFSGSRGIARLWPLVREKWVLFALAAGSSVITILVQRQGGAVQDLEQYSLPIRLANAMVAALGYLEKTVWPAGLAVIYPHPGAMPAAARLAGAVIFVLAVSAMALWQRRQRPYLLFGWLWYLISLLPVIGIIQVGYQAMADRYTYIPLVGIFIAAVFSVDELLSRRQRFFPVAAGIGIAILILLGGLSHRQTGYWQDSFTLFNRALAVTENNFVAHNHLGVAYLEKENLDLARQHFEQTLAIKPDHYAAWSNLGSISLRKKHYVEAEQYFRKSLEHKPSFSVAMNNLGLALYLEKRLDEAIEAFRQSIALEPDSAASHDNLGSALLATGDAAGALVHFDAALRLDDSFAGAWYDRGRALRALGRNAEARQQFIETLARDPAFSSAATALRELNALEGGRL